MEEGGGLWAAMGALAVGGVAGPKAWAISTYGHGGGRQTMSGHGGLGDGQTTMKEGGRQTLEVGGRRTSTACSVEYLNDGWRPRQWWIELHTSQEEAEHDGCVWVGWVGVLHEDD
jgi:hypothetical protein